MTPGPPQSTYLLLTAFCDELARCGLRIACTSPGSRNTPIILTLTGQDGIASFSHVDERSAGFFAVGAARASGLPVAVTCTSGTAAAELAPSVIEAAQARVPLIVLTADRPAQLRDVRAGQAIDQIKLYGDAVKWFCEVELPPADEAGVRWMRQLACRAFQTARTGPAGPVHLNLPLREPLVLPDPLALPPAPGGRAGRRPWLIAGPVAPAAAPLPARTLEPRTVIVAGRTPDAPDLIAAVDALARRLDAPVLADPLSGARRGPTAVAAYDLLLRDPDVCARLAPRVVVRVGDLPTSKPLRVWLAGLGPDVAQIVVDPDGAWPDPDGVASEIWHGDPAAFLDALQRADDAPDDAWRTSWAAADDRATAALLDGLCAEPGLTEPLVARRLGDWLHADGVLFVASSMPIRDVELYLPARVPLPRVLSNRGANGIDGTVSSAFGVAAAGVGPVVLLIGDVALLHDLGGLLAARRLGLELTIVVVNNDGGGIFSFLPVSGAGAAFAEHVATPHGAPLRHAADLFGLRHTAPHDEEQLRTALDGAVGSGAVTLIEVRTKRESNLALHRRLAERGLAAARG